MLKPFINLTLTQKQSELVNYLWNEFDSKNFWTIQDFKMFGWRKRLNDKCGYLQRKKNVAMLKQEKITLMTSQWKTLCQSLFRFLIFSVNLFFVSLSIFFTSEKRKYLLFRFKFHPVLNKQYYKLFL